MGARGATDRAVVKLPLILPLLLLAIASAGCGGSSPSSSPSAYRAPPRQVTVLPDSLDLDGCSSTTMGGGLLAVCDPVQLKRASLDHTLTKRGGLEVEIAGRRIRVGSNSGLTQVVPDDGIGSLLVPAKVTLRGTAGDSAYLYIRAISHKPDHLASGEALFRHLGLGHGGTTTIDVELENGVVRFALRRPDGRLVEPLRLSHVEGPGPRSKVPRLPDHYADTPEQGVRTYIGAVNARDGKTICELWTKDVQARFADERTPCWATATGLIGYGSESDSQIFQRTELVRVGTPFSRASHGVTFTGVEVTLRSHFLESRYSRKTETRDARTMFWFRHGDDGWRIAKDPLFSNDTASPPDPTAARRAAQAREREQRQQREARRRSLVRMGPAQTCPGTRMSLRDPAEDTRLSSDRSSEGARPSASSDMVAASLSLKGRMVCFTVTTRGAPLTASELIRLDLLYVPSGTARNGASFEIDNDYPRADGLHAGLLDPSLRPEVLNPTEVRIGVAGRTLSASFPLPASFPTPRRDRLNRFGWKLWTRSQLGSEKLTVYDSAEDGFTAEKLSAALAAAARLKAARAKAAELARQSAAWAPALVHFDRGSVRCPGRQVRVADSASDVRVQRLAPSKSSLEAALGASADIRSASLAVAGRHVCFSVSFARQPFGRRQRRLAHELGLGLTYKTRTAPYLRETSFVMETNVHVQDGLSYAGIPVGGGATHPLPAGSHFELHGNTLAVEFELEPGFPDIGPAQLSSLAWALSFNIIDYRSNDPSATTHVGFYDVVPNNPDGSGASVAPAIRQSDGKAITPY